MKNILFIFAHYDDEAFSAGTIRKLVHQGNNVNILIVCGQGASLDDTRKMRFIENLKLLEVNGSYLKYFDLTLPSLALDVKIDLKKSIDTIIKDEKIDIVYTNNSGDLHSDHREVSEMVRIICRPSISKIESLYECYIPGAAEFGKGLNEFNTYVDITEYANLKAQCLLSYGNDLRGASSHESSMISSQYFGTLSGTKYAEVFKMIYDKRF